MDIIVSAASDKEASEFKYL